MQTLFICVYVRVYVRVRVYLRMFPYVYSDILNKPYFIYTQYTFRSLPKKNSSPNNTCVALNRHFFACKENKNQEKGKEKQKKKQSKTEEE